jgi:hypothetical protein
MIVLPAVVACGSDQGSTERLSEGDSSSQSVTAETLIEESEARTGHRLRLIPSDAVADPLGAAGFRPAVALGC